MLSAAVLLIGLSGVFSRGVNLLDIDFTGGTTVHIRTVDAMELKDIRAQIYGAKHDDDSPMFPDATVTQIGRN